ncbi:hypothetical protein [Clostridium sp. BL-8]|uniref:hypothetical protein n=1 Tax=Clostridium sp. BL-8 TaxID=349938 RepID=UPI0009C527A7|nr:hypothetical protein CLOBL_30200 [Clostridium sp. BL-8]
MAKQTETEIIKETSYCKIYSQVRIEDYYYYGCIERIEVKSKQREKIIVTLQEALM